MILSGVTDADVRHMIDVARDIEDGVEKHVQLGARPVIIFGAVCFLAGVVVYRADGDIKKILSKTGMKHLAGLVRMGFKAAERAEKRETKETRRDLS